MPELKIVDVLAEEPARPDAADPAVQTWRDLDGTIFAYGYTEGDLYYMQLTGLASFFFRVPSGEIRASMHPGARREVVVDAYRRTVLPMALQVSGREVLHASAVQTPHGVVALCAVSGTGKSTTAFGLSRRGWPLWADDAVVLDLSETPVAAVPLPFGIRLLPEAVAHFEQDARADDGPDAAAETGPLPLAAIFVLGRIQGDDGEVVQTRRLHPAQAFVDVLTHAYSFSLRDEERKRVMMRQYMTLVERVPVFEVRFRAGLDALPAVLDDIRRTVEKSVGASLAPCQE